VTYLRALGIGLMLSLVVFGIAATRTLEMGAGEMSVSDRAFDAGELDRAVRHARRAAALYAPGAAHVDAAYARLRAVALGAERTRDLTLARGAWRAMRAASLESRHVWQPHAASLAEAEASLARLDGSPPASRPRVLHPAATAALAGCLALVVLGFVRVVRRARRASGRWSFQHALAALAVLALGVVGFGLTLFAI
jgi:hypothetical protein